MGEMTIDFGEDGTRSGQKQGKVRWGSEDYD